MKFEMDKAEIIEVLNTYVASMFDKNSSITIELKAKPKSGVIATITVIPNIEKIEPIKIINPVIEGIKEVEENKPEKKKITPLTELIVEDEPEEENSSSEVVTSKSLFDKISS